MLLTIAIIAYALITLYLILARRRPSTYVFVDWNTISWLTFLDLTFEYNVHRVINLWILVLGFIALTSAPSIYAVVRYGSARSRSIIFSYLLSILVIIMLTLEIMNNVLE